MINVRLGSRPNSQTRLGLQVGSLLTHCHPLELSLVPFLLGGWVPHTATQVAHCTHLGYVNHSTDIKDFYIFMTIFQQLAVRCFEERVPFFFLLHKKVPLWAVTGPAEKRFLPQIRFGACFICLRGPCPPTSTSIATYATCLFTSLYSRQIISWGG